MLKFKITNQTIERIDNFKVVSDSRNYLKAVFSFSEEWIGDKTAIFGHGGEFFSVLLEDDGCTVPWEVIKAPHFSVSVVCGDRITTNAVSVNVQKSGYVEGETPKEPTPDVYEQILNSAKPPFIGENGNWYVWDVESKAFEDSGVKAIGHQGPPGPQGEVGPQGEQGIRGEKGTDGYTPARGTDYWTEEDKAEIKAYVDKAILGGAW